MRRVLSILVITFLLLEGMLHIIRHLKPLSISSIVEEAWRITYSNTRTYGGVKGGTQILLPEPHPFDIALVGDSMVFGNLVKKEKLFSRELEKLTGKSVLNLGIASTSPIQYRRMVEVAAEYQPKEVLYFLFANDFALSEFHLEKVEDAGLFIRSIPTKLALENHLKSLTNLSITYQVLKVLRYFGKPIANEYWKGDAESFKKRLAQTRILLPRLLKEANAFLKSKKIKFKVVFIPAKEMVVGKMLPDIVDAYLFYERAVNELGIEKINLLHSIKNAGGLSLYHHIDGHLNEDGHRVVAETLSHWLMHSK